MDEPFYSTDTDEWRQWRANKIIEELGVGTPTGIVFDIDTLLRSIVEAMEDELEQYQTAHAYEHAGLDA